MNKYNMNEMNKIDVKEVILGSFLCLIKEPSLFIPPTIGMRLSSLSFWVSFILSSSYAGFLLLLLVEQCFQQR